MDKKDLVAEAEALVEEAEKNFKDIVSTQAEIASKKEVYLNAKEKLEKALSIYNEILSNVESVNEDAVEELPADLPAEVKSADEKETDVIEISAKDVEDKGEEIVPVVGSMTASEAFDAVQRLKPVITENCETISEDQVFENLPENQDAGTDTVVRDPKGTDIIPFEFGEVVESAEEIPAEEETHLIAEATPAVEKDTEEVVEETAEEKPVKKSNEEIYKEIFDRHFNAFKKFAEEQGLDYKEYKSNNVFKLYVEDVESKGKQVAYILILVMKDAVNQEIKEAQKAAAEADEAEAE